MIEKRLSEIYGEDPTVTSVADDDLLLLSQKSGATYNTKVIKAQYIASQAELDSHTSNTSNPHSVTKSQVGLSNVDNTADINKPISTATQTALTTGLDSKQDMLVSGTNIKTINGTSVLGSGNITIAGGGGGGAVDSVNGRTGAVTGLAEASDVTTGLSGKANTVHSHIISDVTGLQTQLDGKSATSHNHTASQVTDFDTEVSNNTDVAANTSARHTHSNSAVLNATTASYTTAEQTKLSGIATGANVGVVPNGAITGATKTKITYDAKGLVTAGADATTADIADSTNKRYVTDANLTVIGNTSGTNSGDNAVNSLYSGLVSNATHTGDATGATALTLATVNSNVGSFGSATQVGTFTVNAKGLTTAAGNTSIQIAESQVTNLVTDLSGKANSTHTHAESDITNLTADLAAKKTDSMTTNKLLGRGTAGTGAIEEITLGTNLSLTGTTLNATGGGGVSDGDKGDITVSGSGATWTIDAGTVTLAKQADMATASVVYRKTAGSGAPEVQTLATLKTDLGLTGTNSGDQTTISGNAGTATALQTARSIYGNNFDGTAALTQIVASTYGGTGNGFTKFTGPTTAEKTFTLPDASSTIVVQGGALGTPSSGTLTNATGLPVAGITASTSTALGVGSVELGHASDTTISRSAAGVVAVEGVVIPSISSTNTLTNKRVSPRTGTTTSSATPTINTDNVDYYSLTAQTADITSFTTNLSGTPTENQKLWISITGTAARAITWGTSFEASTVALPTTTVLTNRLDVGFVWNTATSKWRVVAVA